MYSIEAIDNNFPMVKINVMKAEQEEVKPIKIQLSSLYGKYVSTKEEVR